MVILQLSKTPQLFMEWLREVPLTYDWMLLYAFGLVALIQLFYYWFYFSRLAFFRPRKKYDATPPVSVVICAKNEYLNLEENLPFFLDQDYPDFEVLVVNDGSDDETELLLHEIRGKNPRLTVINLQKNVNFFRGKKFPLSIGIKESRHRLILVADADCRPGSRNWIAAMVSGFDPATEIVLGYGPYRKLPGMLNKLIRFDTFFIALQYLSFALAGSAYMGVGRNMAYRREVFFRLNGFTSHYQVMSGDDDLFINQAATPRNVRIEIDPAAHTFSLPKESMGKWFHQKRRHMTTGKYYKPRFKFLLGLFSFSQVLFYLLFAILLACCVLSTIGLIAAAIFAIRMISMLIIFYKAGKKLNQSRLSLYSPLFDLLMLGLNLAFAFSAMFFNNNRWK